MCHCKQQQKNVKLFFSPLNAQEFLNVIYPMNFLIKMTGPLLLNRSADGGKTSTLLKIHCFVMAALECPICRQLMN